MRRSVCAAAIVLSTGHAPLTAQGLEVGASLGWYQPLSGFRVGPIESTDLPHRASDLRGVAWGAEARVPLPNRLSIGAFFATVGSTVPGCSCRGGHTLPPTGERVSLVAAEGLYRIPIGGPSDVSVGLGPAMVQHGGEGYSRYGSPKSWGGVGTIEVSRSVTAHFAAAAQARAAAYSFRLDFPPQSGPQLDLLLSLALRWRLRPASPNEH